MADETYKKITTMADELVKLSTTLDSNEAPERKGGVVLWAPKNMSSVQLARVGEVPNSGEWFLYERFAQEKAHRVYADFMRRPEHIVSSWQTRDKEIERYGGAVLFPASKLEGVDIISFSGLKEHVDEAVSLKIGRELGLCYDGLVNEVINVSGNKVYPELVQAYNNRR